MYQFFYEENWLFFNMRIVISRRQFLKLWQYSTHIILRSAIHKHKSLWILAENQISPHIQSSTAYNWKKMITFHYIQILWDFSKSMIRSTGIIKLFVVFYLPLKASTICILWLLLPSIHILKKPLILSLLCLFALLISVVNASKQLH